MLDTEDATRRLLAIAASDVPSGTDLLGGVRKRQSARRTRTRAVLVTAATAAIAAATTIAVTASQTPSALAVVTAAVTRTSAQSYRFTVTSSFSEPDLKGAPSKGAVYGVFNPALGIGKDIYPHVFNPVLPRGKEYQKIVYLVIGDYAYVRINPPKTSPIYGKHWIRSPVLMPPRIPKSSLAALLPPSSLTSPLVSPYDLLPTLHSLSQVRRIGPASGPGWTGTRYAFTAKTKQSRAGSRGLIIRLNGTVDVDRKGRVRAFEDTGSTTLIPKSGPAISIEQWSLEMTFSDFGVTVSVTEPPASQTLILPRTPPTQAPAPGTRKFPGG